MNEQRQMAGGTPIQQALERARLENTQAHTEYLKTIPEQNRQDRLDRQQQQQEEREYNRQVQINERNADTIPRLTKEIEDTTGSGTAAQWTKDFVTPYGHRGNFVDGKWVNDPQNGTYYALPSDETAGVSGNQIADGTPRDQVGVVTTLENANRWKNRAAQIAAAGGRYVEPVPLPGARSTTAGGGGGTTQTPSGGGPVITSKGQYDALPKGAPFTWNGRPGIKP